MSSDRHSAAIARAVDFLRAAQLPHGEFRTLRGSSRTGMSKAVFDSSPFVSTFVVHALTQLPDSRASDMLDKAGDFLRGEMEFGGVWRYWSSRHAKHFCLPPDLDDTACASFALRSMGRRVPRNGWAFRHARDAKGRFLTWLTPSARARVTPLFWLSHAVGRFRARRHIAGLAPVAPENTTFQVEFIKLDDVDPVVNANAILRLGEVRETAAARDYVCTLIREGVPPNFSLYYREPLALLHAVARACRYTAPSLAVLREPVVEAVYNQRDEQGRFANALWAAAAVSVLLTFAPDSPAIGPAVGQILESQRTDGAWDAQPFYLIWGSPELSTAFCLEALIRSAPLSRSA